MTSVVYVAGITFDCKASKFYPQTFDSPAEGGNLESHSFSAVDFESFFDHIACVPAKDKAFQAWLLSDAIRPLFVKWCETTFAGDVEEAFNEAEADYEGDE